MMAPEMLTRSSLAANSAAPRRHLTEQGDARSVGFGEYPHSNKKLTEQGDARSVGVAGGAIAPSEKKDLGFKSTQVETVRYDDASFSDFLSMFNPLNMIPGVSALKAQATGQKTPAMAGLIGGALFGGPIGVVVAGLNMAFEEATGKGMLGSVAAAATGNTPEQIATADQPRDYTAYYSKIANAHQPDYALWQSA
jgi:hypothetical protein